MRKKIEIVLARTEAMLGNQKQPPSTVGWVVTRSRKDPQRIGQQVYYSPSFVPAVLRPVPATQPAGAQKAHCLSSLSILLTCRGMNFPQWCFSHLSL